MKGLLDRTKVVLRHLPPTITQEALMGQIDGAFAGRYSWVSFRPGKNSQKHLLYSRAYIDFKRPEDVIEFAEFFDGHVFVNEKGTQFKTIVEYAPSQRVPKQWAKKDGREGTIFKDPEYMEFLEFLAKPVENLPSAEIQLERREAEKAGAAKDTPIVTPLMDYVRQKRAAKGGSRRSLSNGKPSRRAGGSSGGSPSSVSKRGSEKRRVSTKMYVMRDSVKSAGGKDKPSYILVSKRDDQQLSDKSVALAHAASTEAGEVESGTTGKADTGKKKVLLLKGKERETLHVSGGISQQHNVASSVKTIVGSNAFKQNQRREGSGRIIRSILLNKDACQSQSSGIQSEHQIQTTNSEKERRPPRPSNVPLVLKDSNGAVDDKVSGNDMHSFSEKQEKRNRNKDRPDRGVWSLRRSEGSHASDESLSSSASHSTQSLLDSSEGSHGDAKFDMSSARSGEVKTLGIGRSGHSSFENGSNKHVGRRGPIHSVKDADGMLGVSEGKPSKRGGASGYGSHEKQVWVQKSSSGS